MIYLVVPVMDQHELTHECMRSIADTCEDPQGLTVWVVDNNSIEPYDIEDFEPYPFKVEFTRHSENKGYYLPLRDVAQIATSADLVGLAHNDLIYYTPGWDRILKEEFLLDQRLGLVGLCGSNEVDAAGGRGGGTMCNFAGIKGQTQAAGRSISSLEPAILLDSLFMLFRQPVIECLEINDTIVPCHFEDKIWSMRTFEHGWRVAVAPILIDHLGGQTAVGNQRYEDDAKLWCERQGIAHNGNGGHAVYLEAERQFLSEYRDQKQMIPSRLDGWRLFRT